MSEGTVSKDVKHLYTKEYFLENATGHDEFISFQGRYEQLIEKFRMILRILDLKPGDSLLDIGCGRGELVIYHALNGGTATGVDFSEEAINLALIKAKELGADSRFINQSFEEIEEATKYDKIISLDFIEHIAANEEKIFYKKCYDLLKPGGKLVIYTFPNTLRRHYGYKLIRFLSIVKGKPVPSKEPDTVSDHYRQYHLNEQNYYSLRTNAERAGFKNFTVTYHDESIKESFLKKIFVGTPLRHLFMRGLILIAEK